MDIKKYKFAILMIFIVGILAGLGTMASALYQINEPAALPKIISPNQAAEAVKKFAKVTDIKKVQIDSSDPYYKVNPTYMVTSGDGKEYWVNAKSGKVKAILGKMDAKPLDKSELPLTKEAAIMRAEDHVRTLYEGFDELKLADAFLDSDANSYEFVWRQLDDNGAVLRRWVSVNINLDTGDMDGYSAKDEETTISTKPRVTKEDAIRNAKLGLKSTTKIIGTILVVAKDREGVERLVWGVKHRDDSTGEIELSNAYIDAITGENITDKL